MRADSLRHTDDDAAGERPPQAAEAANDDGLEGVEGPGRADAGVEVGAGAEKEPGENGAYGQARCPWSPRTSILLLDAHELRDFRHRRTLTRNARPECGPVEHSR